MPASPLPATLEETTIDFCDRAVAINLRACILSAQAALPAMKAAGKGASSPFPAARRSARKAAHRLFGHQGGGHRPHPHLGAGTRAARHHRQRHRPRPDRDGAVQVRQSAQLAAHPGDHPRRARAATGPARGYRPRRRFLPVGRRELRDGASALCLRRHDGGRGADLRVRWAFSRSKADNAAPPVIPGRGRRPREGDPGFAGLNDRSDERASDGQRGRVHGSWTPFPRPTASPGVTGRGSERPAHSPHHRPGPLFRTELFQRRAEADDADVVESVAGDLRRLGKPALS